MNLGTNPQYSQDSNPFIEIPDPFKELQKNQAEMAKMFPEALEDDKLCYEVFVKNEFGTKLMERWEKLILMSGMSNPSHPQAMQIALHGEAIRNFIIKLKMHATNHRMRIEAP